MKRTYVQVTHLSFCLQKLWWVHKSGGTRKPEGVGHKQTRCDSPSPWDPK